VVGALVEENAWSLQGSFRIMEVSLRVDEPVRSDEAFDVFGEWTALQSFTTFAWARRLADTFQDWHAYNDEQCLDSSEFSSCLKR
jgi:hypothetical protein